MKIDKKRRGDSYVYGDEILDWGDGGGGGGESM